MMALFIFFLISSSPIHLERTREGTITNRTLSIPYQFLHTAREAKGCMSTIQQLPVSPVFAA